MKNRYVIGVDVGSGSVRAGIFDQDGNSLAIASSPIKIRKPLQNFVEQSSEDIWLNLCKVVKEVVISSKVKPEEILGIGFDATCSLVTLDKNDNPISISPDNDPYWNIIMWMDHRADKETDEINTKGHEVLKYVGGKVNIEMEIPKIMWLKRNQPENFQKIQHFFDLADFLQYKACGSTIRSACTVTCKWNYLSHEQSWSEDFLKQCDLLDLLEGNKIGTKIQAPGTKLGTLTTEVAELMGLTSKTIVATGLIDAHAGALGASGGVIEDNLVIIAGTSACHILNTQNPVFVPGVWGPYYNAMISNLWLNEGGQSAAGALLDYTIRNHYFYPQLVSMAEQTNVSLYNILNQEVAKIYTKNPTPTKDIHILDYHLGNRSPRSDASLKGMVSGLSFDEDLESLATLYLATIQSICYGTKHIVDTCKENGHSIKKISVCGGATKNPLWLQELANITQYTIEIPKEAEAVLLGSAIVAATASDIWDSMGLALKNMSHIEHSIRPNTSDQDFHQQKYTVYLAMYEDQQKYKKIMK